MNYKVKLLDNSGYNMNRRNVGDIVYGHIFEDGKVLFFDPAVRGKNSKPIFDHIFDNIEEAKKYGTCLKKTDYDVKGAWEKMMSDRYW